MAILVTGGAGYIGSHCAAMLRGKGVEVVVIDNLSTGHQWALGDAKFYQGDLRDTPFVRQVFQKENIEAVIHFAAFSLVGESMTNPQKYFENNVGVTLSLLRVMLEFNCRYLIFSSTAATYGIPKEIPILETTEQLPINPYGESKLCVEKILKWYSSAYDLRYCALRYFNVAGAMPDGSIGEAHIPETHLIPNILASALGESKTFQLFGTDYDTPDGTCIRDYVHVCDLIEGHLRALDYLRAGEKSDVFNLGIGHGFSNLEIFSAAEAVTGQKIPLERCARRPGDPDQLIACGDKARTVLGWKPQYLDPESMIQDAWNWQKKKAQRGL